MYKRMYVLYVGGDPFDEACSCPWADLHDKLNEESVVYPLPMVRKVLSMPISIFSTYTCM